MTYFTEDATYPLVILGLVALACLVALRITQEGKFLVWAGGVLVLALVVFLVERLVVTDTERIEAVVYELADAARVSDVAAIEALLSGDVKVSVSDRTDLGVPVKAILPRLSQMHFDVLRVRQVVANAGEQTRRGTAEFKVIGGGFYGGGGFGGQTFPPTETRWALGFREASPGVWRVTRISYIPSPGPAGAYIGSHLR